MKVEPIHSVLKQSSLWRTVHWTVLVAAELRAKRMGSTFICAMLARATPATLQQNLEYAERDTQCCTCYNVARVVHAAYHAHRCHAAAQQHHGSSCGRAPCAKCQGNRECGISVPAGKRFPLRVFRDDRGVAERLVGTRPVDDAPQCADQHKSYSGKQHSLPSKRVLSRNKKCHQQRVRHVVNGGNAFVRGSNKRSRFRVVPKRLRQCFVLFGVHARFLRFVSVRCWRLGVSAVLALIARQLAMHHAQFRGLGP